MRAACTYSSSRIDSACARTIRPTDAQVKKAITVTLIVRLGPTTATRASANTRNGSDSTTSISRERARSTSPPYHPAAMPTTVPTSTASALASTPTSSDTRVP